MAQLTIREDLARQLGARAAQQGCSIDDLLTGLLDREVPEPQIHFHTRVLDAVECAIIVTDLQGMITVWNRFAETLYGWSADELIGKPITTILPEASHAEAQTIMEHLTRGESWAGEFWVNRKAQSPIPAMVIDSPIFDDDGALCGIVGVSYDITERKQAEQQHFELVMERERSRVLASFIENASHEFRTPLSIIQLNLNLLHKTSDASLQAKFTSTINQTVDLIMELVEMLAMMAHLDQTTQFTTRPVHLNSLVRQVVAMSENRDRVLQMDLDPSLPAVMLAPVQFHRALTELVNNAIQHTGPGDTIMVSTFQQDDTIGIEVRDTGQGMSEDIQAHIFERFFREDAARSTSGFGLGLPIARRILEIHGGTITVESVPGEGSTFTIHLPIPASNSA